MKAHLSIIIVAYNVEQYLLKCLLSIYEHCAGLNVEVFVVDNNSADRPASRVRRDFPQVRWIQNEENVGFAKACNQALPLTTAPYILLLNPDTELHSSDFDRLISFLDREKEVGVVGPRLLNSDGSLQGSARGFPNLWTAFFGRSSMITKLFPKNALSRANVRSLQPELGEVLEVDWVSGAAMMVRREVIDQVGGLDEGFFLFWEDADWCYRIKQFGWKIFYYPEVSLTHHVGKSVASLRFRSIIEFHRSAYRWYRKYRVAGDWSVNNLIAILGLNARTGLQLLRVCLTSPWSIRAGRTREI